MSSEELGATEELATKNANLQDNVVDLIGEIHWLKTEVNALNIHFLDAHTAETVRIEMLIKSISHKPLFT